MSGIAVRRGRGHRWPDLDLERGALSVGRALIWTRDGLGFGPPKTRAGRRRISLPASCVAALRAHREKANGSGADNGLVFRRADGSPLPPRTFQVRFGRLVRHAGLPSIRYHDLRHTAATLMLAKGEHHRVVQERLRHSSSKITLDRYSHVTQSMDRRAADRLDRVLGDDPPPGEPPGKPE